MAGMDYCHWRGKRCRYDAEEWHCDFHRAFKANEPMYMKDRLFDAEYGQAPAGVTVERVERREDGAYIFTIVALPDID